MITANEVIHYYFGCMFKYTYSNGDIIYAYMQNINDTGFMCGCVEWVEDDGILRRPYKDRDDFYEIDDYRKNGKMQLILNDTYTMTKKQLSEYKNVCYHIHDLINETDIIRYADTPTSMKYLFDNHIDAFDLLENGEAIDKNTLLHLFEKNDKKGTPSESKLL